MRTMRGRRVMRWPDAARAARETAEELGQARVREPLARLEDALDDGGGLLAVTVARESVRDEGVVVRPHRSVVIAHRIERRIAARQRADPPAGEHVGLHQA